MRCPNRKCRAEVDRILITFDKNGKKFEGCHRCRRPRFEAHVYSGRRLWTGSEVYGEERCKEMNHDYAERQIGAAAALRRRQPIRSR